MASILEQFDPLVETSEEPQKKAPRVRKKVAEPSNTEVEEKREQLSILSVLGTIEEYTGAKLSLAEVKKLSVADVEKYHNRYQLKMGNQISGSLVDMTIDGATEIISYLLPIDDKMNLCNDLKQNELLKQELNNTAGYAVLKGGRFVALGSAIIQIAKHLNFSSTSQEEENKTKVEQLNLKLI